MDYEMLYKVSPDERELCDKEDYIFIRRPEMLDLMEWNGETLRVPRRIKYFIYPRRNSFPFNLNKGYIDYKFVNSNWYKPNLNKVEQFLMKDLRPVDENQKDTCKICTTFSVLYSMMLVPYRLNSYPDSSFTFYVTKFGNKLFLVKHKKKPTTENRCKLRNTYALKFEQYLFADSPSEEPNTNKPIDENVKLYGVYTTALKNFELIYSVRVEGTYCDQEILDLTDMDELCMHKMLITKLMWRESYPWQTHWKTLNWWIHGYLSGVNDIMLGFKDEKGYIRDPIQHIYVQTLPLIGKFRPNICTKFVHKFLTMVDDLMRSVDDPYTVYEIKYCADDSNIQYKIHHGKTELSFLTEDYIEFIRHTEY